MIMARIAFTAGLAIAGSSAAHAAVWNQSAQVSLHAGYDDNVRLSLAASSAAYYGSGDTSLHIAFENETLSWTLDPRCVVTRYNQYRELNRTEIYTASSLQYKRETGSSSLAFNWTRDTTLTSEPGSTGLANVNKPHQAVSLTLLNEQQWTELFDSQGTLFVTSNHYYDNAELLGLVNYNYGTAQFSMGYTPTLRSRLSLDASMGKLQVPEHSLYEKTDQSAMLTYNVSFAERWQGKISAGPSKVKSGQSSESGTVYEIDINRKSETSQLQLKFGRDIEPTGQGVLTRRQQITLTASRDITERLSASVSSSLIKNDSLLLSNDLNFYGVRYTDTGISMGWKWTSTLGLSLNAGHAEQRLQNSDRTAARNYASLSLSWSGLTHTVH
jgi:hypothetical protein